MKFAILFEDNPERAAVRAQLMPDHLAFLERNAATILAAGPLAESGAPAGGLWLVEAADEPSARALVEADPFWPTGLRKSVRILRWNQVFAAGKRLVN
jgi:uncharacterized protein YciI